MGEFSLSEAMPTHVRKKVDALGRFCAKTEGIDPGLLEKLAREAIIPEEIDKTMNDC